MISVAASHTKWFEVSEEIDLNPSDSQALSSESQQWRLSYKQVIDFWAHNKDQAQISYPKIHCDSSTSFRQSLKIIILNGSQDLSWISLPRSPCSITWEIEGRLGSSWLCFSMTHWFSMMAWSWGENLTIHGKGLPVHLSCGSSFPRYLPG